MTHYSEDPSNVRVDIFRPSGKWYTTIELKWDRYFADEDGTHEYIVDTFIRLCREKGLDTQFEGMIAVCLEPYHEHAHPLMISLTKGGDETRKCNKQLTTSKLN